MLDIHSHILPCIDDGSKSVEMSREMLRTGQKQGITTQVCTPHFYADEMRMGSFLERRQKAYEQVKADADKLGMKLLLGAEVAFFKGMSQAESIGELTLRDPRKSPKEASNYLLVEMPFRPWTERDLKEIDGLMERGLTPIIAHVERFYSFQSDKGIIDDLMNCNVLIQCNCKPLTKLFERGKILELIKDERVHFIASDAHNLTERPQNLTLGREVIEKKCGAGALQRLDRIALTIEQI